MRSKKTLPPGLLMSSSAMVLPCSCERRGAAGAAWSALSFIGFTNVVGIRVSLNRISHHLAAARAGRPATQHGREFARRSSGHDDFNRFGRAEFLIARFAVDRDLFVHAALRDALARFAIV